MRRRRERPRRRRGGRRSRGRWQRARLRAHLTAVPRERRSGMRRAPRRVRQSVKQSSRRAWSGGGRRSERGGQGTELGTTARPRQGPATTPTTGMGRPGAAEGHPSTHSTTSTRGRAAVARAPWLLFETLGRLDRRGPASPPGGSVGGGAADHQQRWHRLPPVATRRRGCVGLTGGKQATAGRCRRPCRRGERERAKGEEGASEDEACGPWDE
jgi:hypothetical protein